MRLADLRRASIKSNLRIRFGLRNGMECILNEHGIAQVPALRTVPDFNLEEELAHADRFTIESAALADKGRVSRGTASQPPRILTRSELADWLTPSHAASHPTQQDEHDE